MIIKKKKMNSCSVFHTDQMMSNVVEREYTPDITQYIHFA